MLIPFKHLIVAVARERRVMESARVENVLANFHVKTVVLHLSLYLYVTSPEQHIPTTVLCDAGTNNAFSVFK